MATMKPFILVAGALALLAIVLTLPAEARELLQTEPEAETIELAEAQKTKPEAQETEAEAHKTWGKSPPWHKQPHHGHHGHHDGKKPPHHDSRHHGHNDGEKPPHHGGKKPYPSPPY